MTGQDTAVHPALAHAMLLDQLFVSYASYVCYLLETQTQAFVNPPDAANGGDSGSDDDEDMEASEQEDLDDDEEDCALVDGEAAASGSKRKRASKVGN